MNCHYCGKEAKWIIFDAAPYDVFFMPVCEAHFQENIELEGEMNLEFELIANMTLDAAILKANRRIMSWEKRYDQMLAEYQVARKLLNLKPGQVPSNLLNNSNKTKGDSNE